MIKVIEQGGGIPRDNLVQSCLYANGKTLKLVPITYWQPVQPFRHRCGELVEGYIIPAMFPDILGPPSILQAFLQSIPLPRTRLSPSAVFDFLIDKGLFIPLD